MILYRFFYISLIISSLFTPLLSQAVPTKRDYDKSGGSHIENKQPVNERQCSGSIGKVTKKRRNLNVFSSFSYFIIDHLKNNKKIDYYEMQKNHGIKYEKNFRRRIYDVMLVLQGFRLVIGDAPLENRRTTYCISNKEYPAWNIGYFKWKGTLKPPEWFENNDKFVNECYFPLFIIGNSHGIKTVSFIQPKTQAITQVIIMNNDIDSWLCTAAMSYFYDLKDRITWSKGLKGYSEKMSLYLCILSFIASKALETSPDAFKSNYITLTVKFLSNVDTKKSRYIYDVLAILKLLGLVEKIPGRTGEWAMEFKNKILPKYGDFFGFEDTSDFDLGCDLEPETEDIIKELEIIEVEDIIREFEMIEVEGVIKEFEGDDILSAWTSM